MGVNVCSLSIPSSQVFSSSLFLAHQSHHPDGSVQSSSVRGLHRQLASCAIWQRPSGRYMLGMKLHRLIFELTCKPSRDVFGPLFFPRSSCCGSLLWKLVQQLLPNQLFMQMSAPLAMTLVTSE